jgi:hypothetical protein
MSEQHQGPEYGDEVNIFWTDDAACKEWVPRMGGKRGPDEKDLDEMEHLSRSRGPRKSSKPPSSVPPLRFLFEASSQPPSPESGGPVSGGSRLQSILGQALIHAIKMPGDAPAQAAQAAQASGH